MVNKTILSLDVAMNNLGWICFKKGTPQACGVIKPAIPKELLSLKGKKKLLVRQKNEILVCELVKGLGQLIDEYRPAFITGEVTSGGAQSASAAVKLNMAMSAVLSVCIERDLSYQWCSPGDVKKATAGTNNATKEQIMDWAIDQYGGEKDVKEVLIKKGKRAGKVNRRLSYCFLGDWLPGGTFEHIADAAGAYEAVKFHTTGKAGAKGYRNKPRQLGQ